MSDENKKEVAPSQEQQKEPEVNVNQPEKTIPVDVYGIQVELPLSKAKELITKRDTKTKEYNELKGKITQAEAQARAEAERASLISAMQKQSVEEVENMVSQKYKDTISRFEKKVYEGEIKATLSRLGVIGDAIPDATKLVLADAKAELEGDEVKLNGIKVEDYLKEWTSKKPHLVAVKASDKKQPLKPGQPPKEKATPSLSKGLEKFIK